MKIDTATADDVRYVVMNMRARDFEELRGVSHLDDRETMAEAMANCYGNRPDVLCGSLDGDPICIGGTIETWPGVVSLLFMATDDFPKIGRQITRFIRRELFPRYFDAGVHRIQAVSLCGYDQVHAWLRSIGLSQEGAPMPGFGKNGAAYVTFAKVKNVCSTGH